MRAIVKAGSGPALQEVAEPRIQQPDDVLVRVSMAGMCRTDLAAAAGRIPCPDQRILGHEFTGVVVAKGDSVIHVDAGMRVSVFPILNPLAPGDPCPRGDYIEMLGIHQDGAFSELVRVPARNVYAIPDRISDMAGAFLEPVAACLAVTRGRIDRQEKGLVLGRNRIAALTTRILECHGFSDVSLWDPTEDAGNRPEPSSFDFIVETILDDSSLGEMVRLLRPGGHILVKSRCFETASFIPYPFLTKEISIQFLYYGAFNEAMTLIADDRIEIDDLFGSVYSLVDFQAAFREADESEARKTFLSP